MTPAQIATFKADILANVGTRPISDMGAIVAYYNADAASGFLWRPVVPARELNTAIVWSEFIALPVATQNGYFAILSAGSMDATSANIRAGFGTIFSGTSQTNLVALVKRTPTNFEALYTTSNVCALFGTVVTVADVARALAS
jgi:hypothetical protein